MKKNLLDFDKKDLLDKKVLVRVDFNVPQNEDGSVSEDSRIKAALPTIDYLCQAGARVILVSHLGRPNGKANEALSLKPIANHLDKLMSKACGSKKEPVLFSNCSIGKEAIKTVDSLSSGQVCLLENIRFHQGEEKNDDEFARQLASLADLYVNDAFGAAHRAHASTHGVTRYLKPALAGLLMDKEILMLSAALDSPARPVATIIGGAKVSSKIGVLDNLLDKVDIIVIGGAMAFTFLKARGLNIGKSLVEEDRMAYCMELEKKAFALGVRLILPKDVVCAAELKPGLKTVTVDSDKIPDDLMGLDVGPQTIKEIKAALDQCKTILWNGPLGVFEISEFATGTFAIIDSLVSLTGKGVKTIVGGGDSVAALKDKGVSPD
ncbi:MAG: phosphoglycerate kinase, partial [Candidatus Obscuribacterales bacterium]|nr:phosphoglycerate kinase [Candidatus Obscuribacterales bacterium]